MKPGQGLQKIKYCWEQRYMTIQRKSRIYKSEQITDSNWGKVDKKNIGQQSTHSLEVHTPTSDKYHNRKVFNSNVE